MSVGDIFVYDVCVVGAGWSGVLATKYCLQNGLSVRCVEMREEEGSLGGIWNYQEDVPGGVMQSTVAVSCLSRLEASDFAMGLPNTYFPHHKWMLRYIQEYAKAFGVVDHIQYGFRVTLADKVDGLWYVLDEHERMIVARNVVVCSGMQQYPNLEAKAEFAAFKGTIMHSSEYKEPVDTYNGKNVVVVGGGDSATDIANELSYHTHRTFLVTPYGMWLSSRSDEFFPYTSNPLPLDHLSSRLRRWIVNNEEDPDQFEAFRVTSHVRYGVGGHNTPVFKSPIEQTGLAPFTISNDIIRRMAFQRVVPKPKVSLVSDHELQFQDGTAAHVDVIVLATGFTPEFPFLRNCKRPAFSIENLYKVCLDVDDPTLAFVGFARPAGRGTWMSICESQARYIGLVMSGRIPLPTREQRQEIAITEHMQRDEYFRGANKLPNMEGMVNMMNYNDDLARLCGCLPDYAKLFRQSRKKWWLAVTAPYMQAQFLLNDPRYQAFALERMQVYRTLVRPRAVVFAIMARIVYMKYRFDQFSRRNLLSRLFKLLLYLYIAKRVLQWVLVKP